MRFRTCVGTLMLAGTLAACGGHAPGRFDPSGQTAGQAPVTSSPAAGDRSGTTGTPGAADPTTRTPQGALAAYRAYQRIFEQVYRTGDPAPLRTVAIDPQLSLVMRDLANEKAKGVIWRFHNVLNPKIQGRSDDGSTVVVLDCVRTLGVYRYSAKTGKRLSSQPGGTFFYQAIMKFTGGSWKISDSTRGEKC